MDWLYYFLLLILSGVGLFISILGLPGLWLMLASLGVYVWMTDGSYLGLHSLIVSLILAITSELVEFFAGGAGAKRAGGGKMAMVGAIVGALIGGLVLTIFVPIPILGTILGACVGAFLGAMLIELVMGREMGHSFRVGVGAAHGKFIGIIAKLAIGVGMFFQILIFALPVGGRKPLAPPPPALQSPTTLPTTLPSTLPAPNPTTIPVAI